jgi:hypothetical protein
MPNSEETLALALALSIALGCVLLAVILTFITSSAGAERGAGPEAACAEWTDGCVICLRTPHGAACSTPGIACVPGPARCLRD